ncbi:LAMI_0H18822g1_1 [Lachancea mirantina]|uniref:LAMI_0H18822g1_1 n=1 Tax=Lachancea mirantina TaxID=1230905 RepID=A0A1G4KJM3_9SACH|nr:LAMI_0H18822g1_1 [Lachancea mirantina]
MSGNPIPQLVNISHALQSTFIQQIRTEIKEFSEAAKLTQEQTEKINKYIGSVKRAFADFTKDNEHIERRGPGVTAADIQLYMGLKAMYADYLSQLVKLQESKVLSKVPSAREQQPKEEAVDTSQLNYITDELPYKQPTERKRYIDSLLKSSTTNLPKSTPIFEGIVKLATLDSTVVENVQSYVAILRKIGFERSKVLASIPLPSNGINADDGSAKSYAKPTRKPEPVEERPQRIEASQEEPKKKISFSRYLKKNDTEEDSKRALNDSEATSSKRQKRPTDKDSSEIKIASILKDDNLTKKTKTNPIRFAVDEKLITVYGDELPPSGLKVSPQKLKKILKPFNAGEPRELALSAWKNQKVFEFSFRENVQDTDIVETRGGPISCLTEAPPNYRHGFSSFSKELNKMHKEPADLENFANNSASRLSKPLIVRAFGKNALLLKKDRGGIPYKPVPEVKRNEYPVNS